MPGYDPLDPAHHRDPAPVLADARQRCPVAHAYDDMLVVTRMTDVWDVLTDNEQYSSRSNFVLDAENGARGSMPVRPITTLDPPDHDRVRQLLRRWMAPRRLQQQEPRVRQLVAAALEDLTGSVDILGLAKKLPAQVVYALVGMPEEDWETLQTWTDALHERLPFPMDDMPEFSAMLAYLDRMIDERAAAADPDDATILGGLVTAVAAGELPAADVRTHIWQLITAGTETTSSLIANLIYELLVDPTRWEAVRADRSLVPAAIEESLRHDTPIQFVMRTPHDRTVVGGCPVVEGQQVVVHLQSANWDEQAWGANAAGFDLHRPDVAAHVAFGKGPHACLGAPLARLEARVLLNALLDRFPRMRLAADFTWTPTPELMVRRPTELLVELEEEVQP